MVNEDFINLNFDSLELTEPEKITEEGGPIHVQLRIKRARAKSRIDKYLHARFPRFSRTAMQKLIKEGGVTVNGKVVKPSYEIQPGDKIELILPPIEEKELEPEPIPVDIIYEDKYLVAVNKPKNMVVHPAPGYPSGTLVNAMLYYCQKELSSAGDPIRPGVIHRLDKDTTGVIIFAKDDEAHWRLSMQFERRRIHKEYLAVVEGQVELDSDIIDAPIGAHPYIRERYTVRKEVGRSAITTYEVIERLGKFTFLRLKPQTGRTHQLRVHMSYIGHPIVADTLYGARKITVGELLNTHDQTPIIDRFALHAHKLQFKHPITGKDTIIQAPLPNDFLNLLDILKKHKTLLTK